MSEHPGQAGRDDAAQRLKGAIDQGRTRDKTPGQDPAAAPLGADAEAAGERPPAQLERSADKAQTAPKDEHPNAATAELAPDARLPRQRNLPLWAGAGVVGALVLGAVLWMAL